jgi:hypothetical protein
MKRTNLIQRKESNKIISILTSIMILMGVMIWTAPADAGRLAPVQKKVTSIKRTPLIGKPAYSQQLKKSSMTTKPAHILTPKGKVLKKQFKPVVRTGQRPKTTKRSWKPKNVRRSSHSLLSQSQNSMGAPLSPSLSGGNESVEIYEPLPVPKQSFCSIFDKGSDGSKTAPKPYKCRASRYKPKDDPLAPITTTPDPEVYQSITQRKTDLAANIKPEASIIFADPVMNSGGAILELPEPVCTYHWVQGLSDVEISVAVMIRDVYRYTDDHMVELGYMYTVCHY